MILVCGDDGGMNNFTSSAVSESDQGQSGKPPEASERWGTVLAELRESGLPISVFCRQRGVAQSTLFAWRRRLAGSGRRMTFKAVKVVATPTVGPMAGPTSGPAAGPSRRREGAGVDMNPDTGAGTDASPFPSLELSLPGGLRVVVRRGFDRRLLLDLVDLLGDRS